MVLCANKCDLREASPETGVNWDEVTAFAKDVGATLFQTSAKTGKGMSCVSHVSAVDLDAHVSHPCYGVCQAWRRHSRTLLAKLSSGIFSQANLKAVEAEARSGSD